MSNPATGVAAAVASKAAEVTSRKAGKARGTFLHSYPWFIEYYSDFYQEPEPESDSDTASDNEANISDTSKAGKALGRFSY